MARQTEIDREELEILHALLERRIFNFLQRGNNEAYTPNAIQFIDLQHCGMDVDNVAEIEDLTLMVGVVRLTMVPSAELWCGRRCVLGLPLMIGDPIWDGCFDDHESSVGRWAPPGVSGCLPD